MKEADRVYSAAEAAKVLGICRSTFYTLEFFRVRKIRLSPGRVGYSASDIELYQRQQKDAA